MMQICYMRTSEHAWSWHANVDYANDILDYALKGARNWLDSLVNLGATSYSSEMLRQEALHRYNAGCCGSSNAYWQWLNNTWTVVAIGGAANYLDDVLAKGASCIN